MKHRLIRVFSPFVCAAMMASLAYGQVTTSLSGTVTDSSSAVLPGADVVAKSDDTGATFTAATGANGTFTIPAMPIGRYTVTVSLMGFKTVALSDIRLNTAGPGIVSVKLEVGAVAETITVRSGTEVVQTQATSISTTLTSEQISKLPLVTRDALWGAVPFLAGVDTTTGPRASTINGLPSGAINISIDGVNTQDNNNRSATGTGGGCGFFSLISPRLDAVEEVSISTAAQGADSAGQGAVQIKFTTRSGTNRYTGSAYYYLRDPQFNTNYWFNNRDRAPDPATGKSPKDQVKLFQPGIRLGGPVVIPGLFDGHDKAFFFFNFEQFRLPSQVSRTRRIMTPAAQQGNFQYGGQVDQRALGRGGERAARDDRSGRTEAADGHPRVHLRGHVAGAVRSERAGLQLHGLGETAAAVSDLAAGLQPGAESPHLLHELFPGLFELPRHAEQRRTEVPRFPGSGWPELEALELEYPGALHARDESRQSVRHADTRRSHVYFFTEITPTSFSGVPVGDQAGFSLNHWCVRDDHQQRHHHAYREQGAPERTNPTIDVSDTLTWLKGSHSFAFGASFTHVGLWAYSQTSCPTINFGIARGRPGRCHVHHHELHRRIRHEPRRRAGSLFRADGACESRSTAMPA